MNYLKLTQEILNVGEISEKVSTESSGAISLFVGTTRDFFEEKEVISLEYEAYEPMALKQIQLICEELRRKWPDIVNIAIYHRLGLVAVREASVVIAISSPHRKTSLDAVAVAIDELKKRVPIWKKEMYKGDLSNWKENNESEVGVCEIEDLHPIPSQLVQISAGEDEIMRRMQCFVDKKRDEIDFCNIMDFTDVKLQIQFNTSEPNSINRLNTDYNEEQETEMMTCARANSTVVKQEYSKCHLKVSRVENNTGPQMRPNYLNTLDKLMVPRKRENVESHCIINKRKRHQHDKDESAVRYETIQERLENIEEYINLPPFKVKNIYQRLKIVEDKILYLESISPEYRHFWMEKPHVRTSSNAIESLNDMTPSNDLSLYERKIYSIHDIDTIIQKFE